MAEINQIKISELPTKENPSTNDYLVMDDGSETSRIKALTLFNLCYPVGSIYMSVNDVNPSTLFGGTWEKIKDRFLLASGDTYTTGNTGGEAAHTHDIGRMVASMYPIGDCFKYEYDGGDSTTQYTANYKNTIPNGISENISENIGGGIAIKGTPTQPSNNMPPYIAVNIWKRVS
ncbi:MAG: hypothetical protein MR695_08805 [Solobacterium sp.]|nr:hypothetical protein [Solobacterium sp.]